jgi:hypothetical protein
MITLQKLGSYSYNKFLFGFPIRPSFWFHVRLSFCGIFCGVNLLLFHTNLSVSKTKAFKADNDDDDRVGMLYNV